MKKVGVISLGCAKNLVDTEVMLGMLNSSGYKVIPDTNDADVVLINTCGFIDSAQKESVRTIMETSSGGKKIVMAGCLLERFRGEIEKELPEVSAFVGTSEITEIVEVFDKVTDTKREKQKRLDYFSTDFDVARFRTTFSPYAYVKVSEGCDHPCTFCVIPMMRGKNKSRQIVSIVREVQRLADEGIREVVLVAQDLTAYGHDTGDRKNINLTNLLKELVKIDNSPYYRLLYTYPGTITQDLLELIAKEEKILPYIDMPLQHSHTDILKAMKRPHKEEMIDELLVRMRKTIPDLVLRTTFIVGFPGETDEHVENLKEFLRKHKFEHVGVFLYSQEDASPAGKMEDQVLYNLKRKRRKELMTLQQEIIIENNKKFIGKTLPFFVEDVYEEKGKVVGRTYRDAPEIDGVTTVTGYAQPGEIVNVKIEKFKLYDSFGKIV